MKDQFDKIAKALTPFSSSCDGHKRISNKQYRVSIYEHPKKDCLMFELEVNFQVIVEKPFLGIESLVLMERFLKGETFYNHRSAILNALAFETFDVISGDTGKIKVRLGKATVEFKAHTLSSLPILRLYNSTSTHVETLEYQGLASVYLAIEYLKEKW